MSDVDWASLVLAGGPAAERWQAVFERITDLARSDIDAGQFEQALDSGDRLIADAAFDLWSDFQSAAPTSVEALVAWWGNQGGSPGRAVLILDGLSVREMRLILRAAADREVAVTSSRVVGSPIPTDTQAFANALGLSGRAQLKASGYAMNFVCATAKLWTDVSDGFDFGGLAGQIPAAPDVFLWDAWPDKLLHDSADKSTGPKHFASAAQQVLEGDGFWRLVDRLRQGRRLAITADHGYAVCHRFVDLPAGLAEKMRLQFGASRSGPVPAAPLSSPANPPLYLSVNGRAAIVGPWKWKSPGGYPTSTTVGSLSARSASHSSRSRRSHDQTTNTGSGFPSRIVSEWQARHEGRPSGRRRPELRSAASAQCRGFQRSE